MDTLLAPLLVQKMRVKKVISKYIVNLTYKSKKQGGEAHGQSSCVLVGVEEAHLSPSLSLPLSQEAAGCGFIQLMQLCGSTCRPHFPEHATYFLFFFNTLQRRPVFLCFMFMKGLRSVISHLVLNKPILLMLHSNDDMHHCCELCVCAHMFPSSWHDYVAIKMFFNETGGEGCN